MTGSAATGPDSLSPSELPRDDAPKAAAPSSCAPVAPELYETTPKQTGILYYAGDRNVYPLRIRLRSRGKPFPIPPGVAAWLSFRLPDDGAEKYRLEILDEQNGLVRHRIHNGDTKGRTPPRGGVFTLRE